jgi:uncharacterized C2H2 Zn-finger protein
MTNYKCERCEKLFKTKGEYNRHLERKRSCISRESYNKMKKEMERVKEILYDEYVEKGHNEEIEVSILGKLVDEMLNMKMEDEVFMKKIRSNILKQE